MLIAAGSAAVAGPLALSGSAPAVEGSASPNPFTPKRQFRAMWIATVLRLDWPSPGAIEQMKAEYIQMLDFAVATNQNAVIVQIRPTADAFWPGALEPWSRYLTGTPGQDPGWDPVEFLVGAAHERNLEFHAWFNPYRVSMPASATEAGVDITKLAANHPVRNNRNWVIPYPINNVAGRLYYDPGIPEVRRFCQDAVLDAVAKYDIDGVHFDDYFYPYPAAGQEFLDDVTWARYGQGQGWASRNDWRRNNINLLIQETNQRIKEIKPWVKFGVSPFGIWRNKATDPTGSETNGLQSYDAIMADTRTWIKEGWIDYVIPQVYWNIGFAVADYAKLVPWWSEQVRGTNVHLYVGEANYKQGTGGAWNDPAEMSKHLTFNHAYPEVKGNSHFRAKLVIDDPLGSTTRLVADHYSKPALVPTMEHLPSGRAHHPVIKHISRSADGVTLTLKPTAKGQPFAQVTSYAVYRFAEGEQPYFEDASHLVGAVRATGGETTFVDADAPAGCYYVATALDRLWNESPPSPPRSV
ncbi:MAG TPA: family 10 glycosylhydrolase [Candidatus Limnocylindrales bacterium]